MDINNFNDDTWEEFIEWRPVIINGIYTDYLVSNDGQVKNRIKGNILTNSLDGYGYHIVHLRINKKSYNGKVHRLVAFAFIHNDDPINKNQVNHINGIKTDNRVENLEWCTQDQNMEHMAIMKLNSKVIKYSENQIHQVCKLLEEKLSQKEISKITGVPELEITMIKKGKCWKYVSRLYNIDPNYNARTINKKKDKKKKNSKKKHKSILKDDKDL